MEKKETPLRWLKKPDREDRLWFLAWPIEVKLGTTVQKGMDTDHTLKIWCEWVRVTGDTGYENKFRITTLKDQNGFDYYGSYFKTFKGYINAAKWVCIWSSFAASVMGLIMLLSWWMKL